MRIERISVLPVIVAKPSDVPVNNSKHAS